MESNSYVSSFCLIFVVGERMYVVEFNSYSLYLVTQA